MEIVNDITTVDQLSEVEVVEIKLRGNPALLIAFPRLLGRLAFLVDDPGDSYWDRRLVSGTSQADLENYLIAGQGRYGSDDILVDPDGNIFVIGIRGEKFDLRDDRLSDYYLDEFDTEEFDSVSKAVEEFGRYPESIAWNGEHFVEALHYILRAVQKNKIGKKFLKEHTPPISLIES